MERDIIKSSGTEIIRQIRNNLWGVREAVLVTWQAEGMHRGGMVIKPRARIVQSIKIDPV